jgi:hypothetical protein
VQLSFHLHFVGGGLIEPGLPKFLAFSLSVGEKVNAWLV